MNCIDLTSERSKYWVTSQNIENNAKLQSDQITMNCIDLMSKRLKQTQNYKRDQIMINLHRFDVKTIQNVELRRKTFKTTQNYESDHILVIASIWHQNDQNFWVRWQNYNSNQITMDCIDFTSKRSKTLSYVAKHSKQRKITKLIK